MTEPGFRAVGGRWWWAVGLSAALVGCRLAPEPRPSVPVPAQWQQPQGAARVDAAWWTAFGDPVLTRLVEQALAHNTDLRVAAARVAEARALAALQHGAELPALDLATGLARTRSINPVSRLPYDATGWQAGFEAAYEVDLWGRVSALGDASDARLAASEASRDAVALAVAAATATAYINLRALDQRLDLAAQTLVSRDGALGFARARQLRGYASKLELAQAESEYHATAAAIPQLDQARSRAEQALQVLLGRAPGPVERGRPLRELELPPLPDAGLPSDLLRRRPDIAASEALIAASDAQLAAARAQLLPSVRLTATFGRVGSTALVEDPFRVWSLGGSILAPIFNGGRLRAQVDASRSQRDQALVNYEKTVLVAFSEVEDQLSALRLITQQAAELDAQKTALREALRVAHNRYRAGYATYLEELDAQRSLFVVDQVSVQLRADLLVAQVNLYRAAGGGWAG